jgi:transcriptional activator HAC1
VGGVASDVTDLATLFTTTSRAISDNNMFNFTVDAASHEFESGLFDSPVSSTCGDDLAAGDDYFPFQGNFDINEFVHNELPTDIIGDGSAFETSSHLPETETSPEDPILQPHAGASSYGCDAGGLAASAF